MQNTQSRTRVFSVKFADNTIIKTKNINKISITDAVTDPTKPPVVRTALEIHISHEDYNEDEIKKAAKNCSDGDNLVIVDETTQIYPVEGRTEDGKQTIIEQEFTDTKEYIYDNYNIYWSFQELILHHEFILVIAQKTEAEILKASYDKRLAELEKKIDGNKLDGSDK